MEILYFEDNFFRVIQKTRMGYIIQRLDRVIHRSPDGWRGRLLRITPMFDVTDDDSFVITKSEREKYVPYDPKWIYTIPDLELK